MYELNAKRYRHWQSRISK
uniref:Uncharacterized protein n=1 Tax=Arundo donax TaxID=35708 RepID=A0A0A8ZBC6_ARUDO